MRFEDDRDNDDSLQSEEDIKERFGFDLDTGETSKDFVLRSIAELAESDLSVLHQPPNGTPHLYLVTGEVYRLEDAGSRG